MSGSIVFGLHALGFSILASLHRLRFSLVIGLVFVFVFLAIRHAYGTDFPVYRTLFETLQGSSFSDILAAQDEQFEIEYRVLNKLFAPLGFNALLGFCAVLQLGAFYKIIKWTVPAGLGYLAFFILVFNPDVLLTESSAIRRTLAMSVFLLSIDSLYERKFASYVLACIGASLFHYLALVLIPFYFNLTLIRLSLSQGIDLLTVFLLFVFAEKTILTAPLRIILSAAASNYLGFLSSVPFGVFEIGSGAKVFAHAAVMLVLMLWGKELDGFRAIAIKGRYSLPSCCRSDSDSRWPEGSPCISILSLRSLSRA